MKGHLYRLHQTNEIEKEFNVEKLKQDAVAQKYYCGVNICNACLLTIQFCVILRNFGCLSSF